MAIHFLRSAVLAAAFLPALVRGAPLTLDAAVELAVQRSESARAARAGASSASELARSAAQLPDPVLRAGIENLPVTGPDRLSTTRDSMTMKRVGISQEWLSSEKRSARQAAAEGVVGREAVRAQVAVAETRLQTALAFTDAFYAGEALELTVLMAHHAHEELEAAKARLASAAGSSQEVLGLAGARAVAEDAADEVRQQQSAAQVTLQRWIGVRADELLAAPPFSVPSEDAFVAAHPTVLALRHDMEVAKQAAGVAAANRKPSWTWEVSYGQRTGYSDMVSVGVTIPLPVSPAERQDRDTASKLAIVGKAEAELTEATRAASAEYGSLASDAQRLQARIERYRTGVVTLAAQRTAAATAAYRSNQTTLVTLFESRHAEVEAQRKLLTLQRDLARARVQLAFRPLTAEVAR